MKNDTPLRRLVKSYTSGLLNREQYLSIRLQLLKKLASQGQLSYQDLQNLLELDQGTQQPNTRESYSIADWIIITLGLIAAATLGYFLYY